MPPAASPNFAAIQSGKLPSVGIAAGAYYLSAPYWQVATGSRRTPSDQSDARQDRGRRSA